MICIPLKTWMSWSPEERGEMITYYESTGKKWYIDFTGNNWPREFQKDKDEYREEMSIGGQPFNE